MKTFIPGHNGMVGSSLLRNAPNWADIITVNRENLDLTQANRVADFLITNSVESVILAAALVGGIIANNIDQHRFLYNNLEIQNGVIEGSRLAGVRNLVFFGSSCIYPKNASQPISENSLLTAPLEETNEGFAIAKIAGVRLCRAIRDQYGNNFISLMPANLYGPNDNFHREYSHVPAGLIRRFHEAKISQSSKVTIWGSGKPYREFLFVDDLAEASWHFLNNKNEESLINIGTGHEVSIKDFALMIADVTGFSGQIDFDLSMPDGAPRKLLDVEKARSLGWSSRTTLQEGLEVTYNWFKRVYETGEYRGS